jgi:hypothetical protein
MRRSLVLATAATAFMSAAAAAPHPDLEGLELICYCATAGDSPQGIVKLDNNRELLSACLNGKSTAELRTAGILRAESQLRLLHAWNLLQFKNGNWTTTLPILDQYKAQWLRQETRQVAEAVASLIHHDIESLKSLTSNGGRPQTAYVLFFSYILDGLVWDRFREKRVVHAMAVSVDRPMWDGVFWAIQPRPFAMGTNSSSKDGLTLHVAWSAAASRRMGPLMSDWGDVERALDELAQHGRVASQEIRRIFAPLGLFDGDGKPRVPMIVANSDNAIHQLSVSLSKQLADLVLARFNLPRWQEQLGLKTKEETLVIAYHEFMWELLELLERNRTIHKPLILSSPERAQPSDVAALVFLVRQPAGNK